MKSSLSLKSNLQVAGLSLPTHTQSRRPAPYPANPSPSSPISNNNYRNPAEK